MQHFDAFVAIDMDKTPFQMPYAVLQIVYAIG
jgi:hypothetical protein